MFRDIHDSFMENEMYRMCSDQAKVLIYRCHRATSARFSSFILKSNRTIIIFKTMFLCTYQRPSRRLTPGNPRAFAPRHLQIPPTWGQFSSTKSYCPSPGEHNLKRLPNSNITSCIMFNKSLPIIIYSEQK